MPTCAGWRVIELPGQPRIAVVHEWLAYRAWAERFSEERSRREYADCLEQAWSLWRRDGRQVESLLATSA